MGGATLTVTLAIKTLPGLSPRGRGNPSVEPLQILPVGSIPAWAGQPRPAGSRPGTQSVYPRVGGATYVPCKDVGECRGLSPRGRGNHSRGKLSKGRIGSIPAWAGQPGPITLAPSLPPVYPRVGGATLRRFWGRSFPWGLSPRGRGNRVPGVHSLGLDRSIPAWAGQPRYSHRQYRSYQVYPRVGGATWYDRGDIDLAQGLSPRGRGNRRDTILQREDIGSIPAWAGQP